MLLTISLQGDISQLDLASFRAALLATVPTALDATIALVACSYSRCLLDSSSSSSQWSKAEVKFIMADVLAADAALAIISNTTVAGMQNEWLGSASDHIQIGGRSEAVLIPVAAIVAPSPPPPLPSPPPLVPPPSAPPRLPVPSPPPVVTMGMVVSVGVASATIGAGAVLIAVMMARLFQWRSIKRQRRLEEIRRRSERAAARASDAAARAAASVSAAIESAIDVRVAPLPLAKPSSLARTLSSPHWSSREPSEPLPASVIAEAKLLFERALQGNDTRLPPPAPLPPFRPFGMTSSPQAH